jgi:hypothetical protein
MKTKLLFITFILMATSFQLTAQTVTWDGGSGTSNWTDALNWDTDTLPTASNDVDLNGSTVVLTASTTVQRVNAGGSSDLTINSGVTLTISGFAGGDDGLEVQNSGTVINNGTIAISNIDVGNTDADGLYNKGTFTNNGAITIDGTGQHGIYLQQGTFTNSVTGTITITNVGGGDSGADYVYMDDNGGTPAIFHNHGELDITMTGNDDGIYIKDGSALTNHSTGEIEIISTGGGDMPLHLVGLSGTTTASTLTNDGAITINGTGTSDYGIQIDGNNVSPVAIIINSGTLTVQNSADDGIRIRRGGIMTNSAGGIFNITNAGDEAIQIEDSSVSTGVFNNSGTVNITTPIDHGMECFGTFNNLNGGVFNATGCPDDGIRLQDNGVFNNDGAIDIDGSGSEDIETETVASFINTANATFAPGSSPGDLEIRDDFDLGAATVTFEINGTTATTEYDQIKASTSAETFTVGASTKINLVWGFTPTFGDKFQIIDASGTLSGAIDIANVTSTHTVTVSVVGNDLEVEVLAVLSTNEFNISDFKVYPNPANDFINIQLNNIEVSGIAIYNILGKEVLSQNRLIDNRVDVSNLDGGIYFMKINSQEKTVTKKIIIEE